MTQIIEIFIQIYKSHILTFFIVIRLLSSFECRTNDCELVVNCNRRCDITMGNFLLTADDVVVVG